MIDSQFLNAHLSFPAAISAEQSELVVNIEAFFTVISLTLTVIMFSAKHSERPNSLCCVFSITSSIILEKEAAELRNHVMTHPVGMIL